MSIEAICHTCQRTLQLGDPSDPTCPVCASPVTVLGAATRPQVGPNRVLIVDDSDDARHMLRLMFESEGFEVVGEAENGLVAIAVALRERPDFVILDYAMPALSGRMTAETLRPLLPDVTIVAFSGYLHENPAWADAYLNKDDLKALTSLVARLRERAADKKPPPDRLPLSADESRLESSSAPQQRTPSS